MAYWQSIWVGVVAGVLTSGLLFLAARFWETTLLPFLKETRYQGVVVQGTWQADLANDPGEPTSHAKLMLTQSTHTLTGIFHFTNRKPGNDLCGHRVVQAGRGWHHLGRRARNSQREHGTGRVLALDPFSPASVGTPPDREPGNLLSRLLKLQHLVWRD